MTQANTSIEAVMPIHPLWIAFVAHLRAVDMVAYALNNSQPKADTVYLAAIRRNNIIGHISIRKQSLIAPATAWSQNKETPIQNSAGLSLYETFVQTFAITEDYRRQGYGRALQQAALNTSRELGCYQMRSWSSIDKHANYALKISMGFAIHPAIYSLPDGRQISGVYFVKRL